VIATEIGYRAGPGADPEQADYGPRIIKYLESHGISWVAWVFDPDWEPAMIGSWDTYSLTEMGKFFSDAMQGKVR